MNHCAARSCGRWVRAGDVFCNRHQAGSAGNGGGEPEDEGPASFRARLAAGDYDALFDPGLRDALRRAAAEGGMEAEIGALRVAMMRLLEEEGDPSRMAAGVARVAGVSLQAVRLRQDADGAAAAIEGTVTRQLAKIDAEHDARQRGGKEVNDDDSE